MPERKTVGQLMDEMRLKAGAQNYHGHEYMDLQRFAEDTRHMASCVTTKVTKFSTWLPVETAERPDVEPNRPTTNRSTAP